MKKYSKQKLVSEKVDINPTILIITLNVYVSNTQIKRQTYRVE